ncbi:MAG: polyketide beta-ketoacyl:ACP synthase [Myxococcales bacterium]|nr:polyketide beta-ketoacyl:ACP synthase [Myxococcales bacterium]
MRPAVVGLGAVSAAGVGVDALTATLREGTSRITAAPWGPDGPPFGAALPPLTMEGALAARGALPAALLERAHRALRRAPLPLQVAAGAALEAWEHARLHDAPLAAERIALVVAGSNLTGGYVEAQRAVFASNPGHLSPRFALHSLDTDHVGTLSEILGIRGEGFTVGGASASGNLAIIQASRLLALGEADACVVVGALPDLSRIELQGLVNIGAMAHRLPDAPGRLPPPPFDHDRRGFVLGQASACLILETAGSARRRQVPALAHLLGHAAVLDGSRLAAPSIGGEQAAMTQALARAELAPAQLGYVSAHGSGSELGDSIELAALRAALGDSFSRVWINSTKALTGHCLGAAGVLEAVATVLQLQGGFIHAMPGLAHPIDVTFRFPRGAAARERVEFALSNSFGFGGISSSIVLAQPRALDAATTRSVTP